MKKRRDFFDALQKNTQPTAFHLIRQIILFKIGIICQERQDFLQKVKFFNYFNFVRLIVLCGKLIYFL